jgi:hypothetical protein
MVIGNFDPVGQVDGTVVNPGGIYGTCYYYIDNVVVRPVVPTNVPELSAPRLWWNGYIWQMSGYPCSGNIDLDVFNVLGAVVHHERTWSKGAAVNLGYDPPSMGSYVLRVRCGNSSSVVRFIK